MAEAKEKSRQGMRSSWILYVQPLSSCKKWCYFCYYAAHHWEPELQGDDCSV